MSRFLKVLPILLLIMSGLYGDNPERERLFVKANSYYSSNQYSLALDLYEEIAASGTVSFDLYYNMGNSYYRMGQIGSAIRYWEKARRLEPRNSSVNHNLDIARLQITDKIVMPKAFLPFQIWWDMRDGLGTATSFRWSGYLLFIAVLLIIILSLFKPGPAVRKRLTPIIIAAFLGFVIFISLAIDSRRYNRTHQYGILLKKQIEVKSAPRNESNTLFMLHEGSKVRILNKSGTDWLEISYFDDKVGWIKSKDLGEI
jgi:tetratricopeptide (TPR) repeat protein